MRPPSVPTTIPINRDDSKQVVIMKSLYNTLIEHREAKTQRILIQVFMCLPSRKDFPEYFNIISKPIAMNKIRERIERQQYLDEEACMEDFKLMFSNCKFFNEDDSQIHKDAVFLEAILRKKREQLQAEYNRSSQDSKDSVKETILNATTTANTTITTNSSPSSTRGDRLNNDSSHSNQSSSETTLSASSVANSNHVSNKTTTSPTDHSVKQDGAINNNNNTTTTNNSKSAASNSTTNHNNTSSNYNSSTNHNTTMPSSPNKTSNTNNNSDSNNGLVNNNKHISSQQTDSTNNSRNDHQNGNEDTNSSSININHNHHHETSMDSSSNISADLLASTPVEKCSLNTRRGRNADAPKRQLLTGYIIYASEIRKQVIDKNPNQNFGDISRLVGNEWKALPHDIRSKYDQRALIHNKRVRERAQRELNSHTPDGRLSNGLHTPKMTKRKLAKIAKEQMRQHHLSLASHNESTIQSPRLSQDHSSSMVSQTPSSAYKHPHHQHSQPQSIPQATSSKSATVDTSTQTNAIRFVEPPTKKRLVYSDTFRKYIESLQVPNRDFLAEETTPERPPELPTHWLGAGVGRHDSPEAALWALRDFMLQDAATMRRSMEPYL